MRIATIVLASLLLFLSIINAAGARERKAIEVIGHLQVFRETEDKQGIPVCHCFDPTPPNCFCAFFASARTRGVPGQISYDDLITLDSFDSEDDHFLYFRVGTREDTELPVFDLSVRGDALVKISKQGLREHLLSEE